MVNRKISHFDDSRVPSNKSECSSNLSECSSNLSECSSNLKNETAKVCSGIITQTVPNQICINATNLERKKGPYDQFKFPRSDPPLTEAGKLEIPKIESLEYIVNLLAGKLQPDLKNIWDQISGRDVSKTEISKSGMQLTGYDIKNECAIYKKACEKARYVTSLTDTDTLTNNNISIQASKTDCQVLASQISQTNVINFRNPTDGPLYKILLQCGFDQQSFFDCLFTLFYKSKNDLLTLLNEIEIYMIFKKHRKKLHKFKKLLEYGEKANRYKVNYYLKFISRIVQQRKKI